MLTNQTQFKSQEQILAARTGSLAGPAPDFQPTNCCADSAGAQHAGGGEVGSYLLQVWPWLPIGTDFVTSLFPGEGDAE